jgi:hypothetical protein
MYSPSSLGIPHKRFFFEFTANFHDLYFAQKQYPQHLTFFNNQKNHLKPTSKGCNPGKGRNLVEKNLFRWQPKNT